MKDVLAIVLAGGKGSRLEPMTRDRAKPAVPFGGNYRIIDFALSNVLNSGIRKTLVMTQYKAQSLDRHINLAWQGFFCREMGEYIDILPPQQRIDECGLSKYLCFGENEVRLCGNPCWRPYLQNELREDDRVSQER